MQAKHPCTSNNEVITKILEITGVLMVLVGKGHFVSQLGLVGWLVETESNDTDCSLTLSVPPPISFSLPEAKDNLEPVTLQLPPRVLAPQVCAIIADL